MPALIPVLIAGVLFVAWKLFFLPTGLADEDSKGVVRCFNVVILLLLVPNLRWYLLSGSWIFLLISALILRKRAEALAEKRRKERRVFEQKRKEAEEKQRQTRRQALIAEFRELAERFSAIRRMGDNRWSELIRAAQALHGDFDPPSFVLVLRHDTLQILKSMAVANGSVHQALGKIYFVVRATIEPNEFITVDEAANEIVHCEHRQVHVPIAVEQLHAFCNGTDGVGKAIADAYCAVVETAFGSLPSTTPVNIIRSKWLELLRPYISKKADSSRQNHDRKDSTRNHADDITEAYELLGLHPNCTDRELRAAYHQKVSYWHPDKFHAAQIPKEMKDLASREMSRINEAYEQVRSRRQRAQPVGN